MLATRKAKFRLMVEPLETRRLLSVDVSASSLLDSIHVHSSLSLSPSATSSKVAGLSPAQAAKAYGYDQISFNGVKGDGSGQTIAVVGAFDAPNILSDLKTFDKQFSLTDPSFKKVSQSGSTTSLPKADSGWALELSLDVEWAHAMAPKANILLVEAKSDNLGDLLTAVDTARKATGVSVVSMSWGADEFWGETSYDYHFTTPAGHQGVTFISASGDSGSWYGAEWPAVSPGVLSVGGTSLSLSSSGTYSSERGWSGSGGGISDLENAPNYQSNVQGTGARTSPDVAFDADPHSGFAVYDSTPFEGFSGWQVIGGTSAGAPQWAALIAIANQGRVLADKSTLNGQTQTLPALYAATNSSSTYTADFHDIASGRTSWWVSAFSGYDLVSGLGSPKASAVAQLLKNTGSSVSTSAKTATAKTATTSAKIATASVQTLQTAQLVPTHTSTPALKVDHAAIVATAEAPATAVSGDSSTATSPSTHVLANKIAQAHSTAFADEPRVQPPALSTPPAPERVEISLLDEMFHSSDYAMRVVSDPAATHAAGAPAPQLSTAGFNLTTFDNTKDNPRSAIALLAAAGAVILAQWHRLRKRGMATASRFTGWSQDETR